MNINVHIERLILDGVPESHAQGPIIGAAMETELTRLLATGGLEASLQSGGAWPNLPVSIVQLTASKPAQLGQQIAQAIYGGIGQKESSTSRTKQGITNAS
jgi:hypothetical protein